MDLINTLKDFYSTYGVENEGPSPDTTANDMAVDIKAISSELFLLNQFIQNVTLKRDFNVCKKAIDELANKLSDKAQFIEELNQIRDKINLDVEGISNGIIWFRQAQETDPRFNNNSTVKESEITGIPPSIIGGIKTQGSLILQLYIALVYMRSGPVSEILKVGSTNKCQAMNCYKKLINSDYIRHIRNSLSHGTFKINIAGVYFKDEEYEMVSTPGFLDKICIWLFVIYYQCILFAGKELNNSKT